MNTLYNFRHNVVVLKAKVLLMFIRRYGNAEAGSPFGCIEERGFVGVAVGAGVAVT
jgi:hypothetical protein